MDVEAEDKTVYRVVVNDEEQYSIWPADKEDAPGWRPAGKSGPKPECLEYIREVWTDMRPLSLRKRMEEDARRAAADGEHEGWPDQEAEPSDPRDDLVAFLCDGMHPVELKLRPENTTGRLREAIERGYVLVRFTDTRGGTELSVNLDKAACDLRQADFDGTSGRVRLVGNFVLNYVPVRLVAEIDLSTFAGQGRLETLSG